MKSSCDDFDRTIADCLACPRMMFQTETPSNGRGKWNASTTTVAIDALPPTPAIVEVEPFSCLFRRANKKHVGGDAAAPLPGPPSVAGCVLPDRHGAQHNLKSCYYGGAPPERRRVGSLPCNVPRRCCSSSSARPAAMTVYCTIR